jgi:hypothetical protein
MSTEAINLPYQPLPSMPRFNITLTSADHDTNNKLSKLGYKIIFNNKNRPIGEILLQTFELEDCSDCKQEKTCNPDKCYRAFYKNFGLKPGDNITYINIFYPNGEPKQYSFDHLEKFMRKGIGSKVLEYILTIAEENFNSKAVEITTYEDRAVNFFTKRFDKINENTFYRLILKG